MDKVAYKPIGIIYSPFKDPKNMPLQSTAARGIAGKIELFPEYSAGLKDVDGFSHLILLYHFHLVKEFKLVVRPYIHDQLHGVFATRMPGRPNSIGLSVVRLTKIVHNILYIEDVDVLDGTPLLDIKPYVANFDVHTPDREGWLSAISVNIYNKKSDGRFY